MVPPDVREPNFWYVFIPPSLSCVSRGLQACTLRLTGVYVLAHIERSILAARCQIASDNAADVAT
jgi:hypothetical protein